MYSGSHDLPEGREDAGRLPAGVQPAQGNSTDSQVQAQALAELLADCAEGGADDSGLSADGDSPLQQPHAVPPPGQGQSYMWQAPVVQQPHQRPPFPPAAFPAPQQQHPPRVHLPGAGGQHHPPAGWPPEHVSRAGGPAQEVPHPHQQPRGAVTYGYPGGLRQYHDGAAPQQHLQQHQQQQHQQQNPLWVPAPYNQHQQHQQRPPPPALAAAGGLAAAPPVIAVSLAPGQLWSMAAPAAGPVPPHPPPQLQLPPGLHPPPGLQPLGGVWQSPLEAALDAAGPIGAPYVPHAPCYGPLQGAPPPGPHAAAVQAAVEAALAQVAATATASAAPAAAPLPQRQLSNLPIPTAAVSDPAASGALAIHRSSGQDYYARLWEHLWAAVAGGVEPKEAWPRRDPQEPRQVVFAQRNLRGSGASALAGPSGGTLKFCGTRSAGGGGDVDVDVAGGNAAPRYEGDMYLYKTRGKVDGGGNAEWPEGSVLERCQLALPTRAFTEQEALAKLGVPSVEKFMFRGRHKEAWVYTEKFLFVAEKADEQPRERRASAAGSGRSDSAGLQGDPASGQAEVQQATQQGGGGGGGGGRRAQRLRGGGGSGSGAAPRPQTGRRRRRSEAEAEAEHEAGPAAVGSAAVQAEARQGLEVEEVKTEEQAPPLGLSAQTDAAAAGSGGASSGPAAGPRGHTLPLLQPGLPGAPGGRAQAQEPPSKTTWRRVRAHNCAAAFMEAVVMGNIQAMQALLPELPRRGKPPAIDWPALTCTVVSTAADATSGRRRERHTSSYSPLHLALTFVEMWPHRPEATQDSYTVPRMAVACSGCLAAPRHHHQQRQQQQQQRQQECGAQTGCCRLGLVRWLLEHSTPAAEMAGDTAEMAGDGGSGACSSQGSGRSPLLSLRTTHSGSVPLMTLMRYADADGQDWSPLVAEVMAHMTWSEYAAAEDDDDARSKKGWYPHHIGASQGDRWRRPPTAQPPGGLPGSDKGSQRCLEECLRQLLRLAKEWLLQQQQQQQQQQQPGPGQPGPGQQPGPAGGGATSSAGDDGHRSTGGSSPAGRQDCDSRPHRTGVIGPRDHCGTAAAVAADAGSPVDAAGLDAAARAMVAGLMYGLSSSKFDGQPLLEAVARSLDVWPEEEEEAGGGGGGSAGDAAAAAAAAAAGLSLKQEPRMAESGPVAGGAVRGLSVAVVQPAPLQEQPQTHAQREGTSAGPAEARDGMAQPPAPPQPPPPAPLPPPPPPPTCQSYHEYERYCTGKWVLSGRLRQLLRLEDEGAGCAQQQMQQAEAGEQAAEAQLQAQDGAAAAAVKK